MRSSAGIPRGGQEVTDDSAREEGERQKMEPGTEVERASRKAYFSFFPLKRLGGVSEVF